jgi:electron transfer flavoprotein alpha subunit
MTVLVIAEHDNGSLKSATLNTLAAAAKIGGDVDVLVAGKDVNVVANAAASVVGVRKVLVKYFKWQVITLTFYLRQQLLVKIQLHV